MNKNQNYGKKSLKSFVNKSRKSTKTEIAKNRKILCEILGKIFSSFGLNTLQILTLNTRKIHSF